MQHQIVAQAEKTRRYRSLSQSFREVNARAKKHNSVFETESTIGTYPPDSLKHPDMKKLKNRTPTNHNWQDLWRFPRWCSSCQRKKTKTEIIYISLWREGSIPTSGQGRPATPVRKAYCLIKESRKRRKPLSKTRESLALYPLRVGNSLSLFLSYRCLFFFVYNARSTTLKGSDHYNKDQAHIQTYKTRSPPSEIQDSSRKINPNRNSDMTTNTSLWITWQICKHSMQQVPHQCRPLTVVYPPQAMKPKITPWK